MFAFAWLWRMSTASLLNGMGGIEHDKHVDREEAAGSPDRSKLSLLRDKNLWLITISYAAYGYFQYLFFYWMGYYFKEVLHVPDVEGAMDFPFGIMLSQGAGMAVGARHRLYLPQARYGTGSSNDCDRRNGFGSCIRIIGCECCWYNQCRDLPGNFDGGSGIMRRCILDDRDGHLA